MLRFGSKIGLANWRGMTTLLSKEVRRFLKVPLQTVLAPMMTTILFLAIFTLAFGGSERYVGDVSYANFLAPLSPAELTLAYVLSGLARGVTVALAVGAAMWVLIDISVYSWVAVIYYTISAGLMLSLLGMIAGIVSEKFDHMAAMTNFVIMPLSFLSGTFYSIDRLTGIWYQISHLNPFFYMIDGFRYGFIGTSDSSIWVGALLIASIDILLYIAVWALIRSGYRLKA